MRREAAGKPKISINMEETLFKLAFQMLKPSAAKDVTAKVSSFAARGRLVFAHARAQYILLDLLLSD